MRIELFGLARARAGTDALDVEAQTLGEALRALEEAFPALAPERFLFSLNGRKFVDDPDHPLAPEDTLVVMGAQAGG